MFSQPPFARALTPLVGLCVAASAVLSGCGFLSKDKNAPAYAADAKGPPSFALEINSPNSDVQKLLSQHMDLQQYRYLPDLRITELTRLMGSAEGNVRELLGTLGYFSPTIELQLISSTASASPSAAPADSTASAPALPGNAAAPPPSTRPQRTVVVTVDPGPPTTITQSEVHFSGPNAEDPQGRFLRESVRRNWPLQPGNTFTQSDWSSGKSGGLSRLQARRYPTAQLADSRADIDADLNQAQTSVTYNPGPAYLFGPLVIEGAERYNPSGPIRTARLPVGEEYRLDTLLDAQQRLASTGYYESVFLTLFTDAANPGDTEVQAPVIAQVREAKLQKWVYGLGFSTDTGVRLSLDHTHNRVPWLEWRALTKMQLDQKHPKFSTQLISMPDYSGWNRFVGLSVERADLADYDANSISLTAGRSKQLDKIDRTYYLQYDYANPQGFDAPPSSSAITGNYGWTGRYFNNPTAPTRGYGFAWEVGGGSTLSPNYEPFGRLSARWLYLRPFAERDEDTGRRGRLAVRAQAGSIVAKDDTVVPITQLFLSGGDTTVRGYNYQSIGARTSGGNLIGGRYMAAGSVEWQRPITIAGNTQAWEQTVFVDAGTVTDKLNESVIYVGAGTGIRWASPVGPLQADLAYGFKTQGLRLHLRLGFNF